VPGRGLRPPAVSIGSFSKVGSFAANMFSRHYWYNGRILFFPGPGDKTKRGIVRGGLTTMLAGAGFTG